MLGPFGDQSLHSTLNFEARTAQTFPTSPIASHPRRIWTLDIMNCPSRTDDTLRHPCWNQNPSPLNADSTTAADLNGVSNAREQKTGSSGLDAEQPSRTGDAEGIPHFTPAQSRPASLHGPGSKPDPLAVGAGGGDPPVTVKSKIISTIRKGHRVCLTYAQFIGPGMMISVAYIDPGNYATDVQSGAVTRFSLLFIVLMSNIIAIFLQSLCIKLGSVTGMNLAENCRQRLPKWLNLTLYVLAEGAIIATDIAEVRPRSATCLPFFWFFQHNQLANSFKSGTTLS